jgi:flavin reductase (DIM6/NTAB) family NADH-FMN oxidoreductase RutF
MAHVIEASAAEASIDARAFRDALGCFATGVTVITTAGAKGEPIGITANSFSSVSLDPPLILFSLGRYAYSLKSFLSTHHFAVNILHEGQEEISNRFARASSDKWAGIEFETWESGCPILSDALASFECHIRHTYHGGDHVILVGEVIRMRANCGARPLLFLRGRYGGFEPRESAGESAGDSPRDSD